MSNARQKVLRYQAIVVFFHHREGMLCHFKNIVVFFSKWLKYSLFIHTTILFFFASKLSKSFVLMRGGCNGCVLLLL